MRSRLCIPTSVFEGDLRELGLDSRLEEVLCLAAISLNGRLLRPFFEDENRPEGLREGLLTWETKYSKPLPIRTLYYDMSDSGLFLLRAFPCVSNQLIDYPSEDVLDHMVVVGRGIFDAITEV